LDASLDRAAGASPDPETSEVRAELEAVLRSPGFERTPRLQRFLRYIADLTLRGEGERLHEHLIAQDVFDRGSDYSPGEDSIVRRQAHALRAKLERFYVTEGADHAIVIEMPIGRYMPVFRRRSPAHTPGGPSPSFEQSDAALGTLEGAPKRRSRRRLGLAAAGIALFGAGLTIGALAQRAHERAANASTARDAKAVWGGWLKPDRGVVVCFTNRMTASLRYYPNPWHGVRDGWDLPERSDGEALFRSAFGLPRDGRLNVLPEHVMIKVGDAQAAARLASFFGERKVPLRTLQSRHLTWDLLRRESIVLLGQTDRGHSGIAQWFSLLLDKYPFQLAPPDSVLPRRIVNTAPLPGEPSEFVRDQAETPGRADEMVALISMLPGVDPHRELLLINGIDAPAADMAAEFLTNPETLAALAARLRASPSNRDGTHFQLVLRAEVREYIPTRATIVALRIL
jgi:hypothetical protein